MGGSSGGSQPQQVTQTTSNLPDYARPYFEDLLNRTGSVAAQGYTAYPGQRLAGGNAFTDASREATANAGRYTGDYMAAATNGADIARGVAGNLAGYQAGQVGSGYAATGYQPGTIQASQVGTGTFGGNAADYYMSPYQQRVTDVAKNAAVLDFQRGRGARDDSAIRSGAFGGSRQAIQSQLASEGLATQLGTIQAQGSQSAFDRAQAQFNQDQGRSLAAQQANQSAGLTAQQQTEQSRQFGATFGDSSQRYANDAAMKAAMANEDNRARAAGIQQQGGQLGMGAAQAFGQIASTDQSLALAKAQALGGVGSSMTQTQQQGLDMAYQDFVNQRDYDRQNLNFYSGILRGTPVSAQSEVSQYQAPGNQTAQLLGTGIAGLGAYKALQ